ncbi:MAG: hypothetical protein IM606_11000 [Cytophagales bacterium]|jgi:hypothetical protein|nr:hypothetical protein [Cytophagales bacterium]MCA6392803.1 hypothetical protein [Cytophagales bacterium]MCA6395704.1 hypothetical protein [Cytophagales bacterium]MCA6403895.1 hypothetical protein [Cytophagales bacterium]MCA6405039.1 hypothetical protein [Cytophagales bacterium]
MMVFWKKNKLFLVYAVLLAVAFACTGSEYERLKDKELARNVRYDSLFLGLKFGMTKKEFFKHCWDLNKAGVLSNGPSSLSVQYRLDSTQLRAGAYMWFYPEFKDDKIVKMPIKFTYREWAPWNQQLSSDSLLFDVTRMMEKWYGGRFIEVKSNTDDRIVKVKIDGNRRIRLFKESISTIRADITDLKELEKELANTEKP